MNTPKFIAVPARSTAIIGLFSLQLAACTTISPSVGVSVPILGNVSVGAVIGPGGVTATAGVRSGPVHVGVGVGTSGVTGSAGVSTSVGGATVGVGASTNGTVSAGVGVGVGGATVGVGASVPLKKPAEASAPVVVSPSDNPSINPSITPSITPSTEPAVNPAK